MTSSSAESTCCDILHEDAGTDVVNAKNGKGSATLSMAYAGARPAEQAPRVSRVNLIPQAWESRFGWARGHADDRMRLRGLSAGAS